MNSLKNTGFTLIELMVVIAILAIIGAVAIPAYQSQTMKQRRSDAFVVLTIAKGEMERARSDNGVYTLGGLSTTTSPEEYYTVSVTVNAEFTQGAGPNAVTINAGENYTLTAEAASTGRQASDSKCRKFIVNDLGQHSSEKSDGTASTGCFPK